MCRASISKYRPYAPACQLSKRCALVLLVNIEINIAVAPQAQPQGCLCASTHNDVCTPPAVPSIPSQDGYCRYSPFWNMRGHASIQIHHKIHHKIHLEDLNSIEVGKRSAPRTCVLEVRYVIRAPRGTQPHRKRHLRCGAPVFQKPTTPQPGLLGLRTV
jgi:hypothetical protein